MPRTQDIKEKLAFTLLKYQRLGVDIRTAQEKDEEVPFIGQLVGDILSGCRECFDYCAKDMADAIARTSTNQKLVSKYLNGKIFAYFPFTIERLSTGKLFFELSITDPPLYAHLLDLAAKIAAKTIIPDTISSFDLATEINDLVNSKKHDKITVTTRRENAATKVTFPDGSEFTVSPLFQFVGDRPDFAEDLDAQPMIGTEGVKIKYVKEYKLSHNNWEVHRFCLHAIQSTTHILTEIYQLFLGTPAEFFNPWETIKPEAVKKAEAALKSLSPIASRPLRLVLFLDDKETANLQMSFDGQPTSKSHIEVSLTNWFLIVFERYVSFLVRSKLNECILKDWERINMNPARSPYWELQQPLPAISSITVNGTDTFRFNRILWGIGSKYRCDEAAPKNHAVDQETLQAAAVITKLGDAHFSLKTDDTGTVQSCTAMYRQ